MQMKKKTYPITLSKAFPTTHPRHGQPTNFRVKYEQRAKIHTIRANFPWWDKRFDDIYDSEAVLSLRQWSGKPYHSVQELVADLGASDLIGLQELVFVDGDIMKPHVVRGGDTKTELVPVTVQDLTTNDGLSVEDWLDWFNGYDLTKSMAIIHLTEFRY